jgi:hypothetical protein
LPTRFVIRTGHRSYPVKKRSLKLLWFDERQDATDGVMRWRAVLEFHEFSAPTQLRFGKAGDIGRTIATGDSSGDANEKYVDE